MKPPAWVMDNFEDPNDAPVQSEESIIRCLKDISKFTQREIDIYALKHWGHNKFHEQDPMVDDFQANITYFANRHLIESIQRDPTIYGKISAWKKDRDQLLRAAINSGTDLLRSSQEANSEKELLRAI